jgi:hypothetical protein
MTPAEVRRMGEQLARRTRAAQQLPRRVRDREVAHKIAALLVNGNRESERVEREEPAEAMSWKAAAP